MKILNNQKQLTKDIGVIIAVGLLPFLFFTYTLLPDKETVDMGFFIWHSGYYESVQVYAWTLFSKLLWLTLGIIWFVTCKHWWRNVILIPVVMELLKVLEVMNDEMPVFDDFTFVKVLPLAIPLVLLLFYISYKLRYYNKAHHLREVLNDEISGLMTDISHFEVENYKSIREELTVLRRAKETMSENEYLEALLVIRDKLES